MTTLASTPWQESIRLSIDARNASESTYADIINQYRRLAKQAKQLKIRNQALLRAATSVRSEPGRTGASSGGGGEENPVLHAYVATLETQINSLKSELSDVYKQQGTNTQKLLTMTETLQERDYQARADQAELARLTEAEARWKRSIEEWTERNRMKDRDLQAQQDEQTALNLELEHTLVKLQKVQADNKNLLSRWIDHMSLQVDRMNAANEDALSGPSEEESSSKLEATEKQKP